MTFPDGETMRDNRESQRWFAISGKVNHQRLRNPTTQRLKKRRPEHYTGVRINGSLGAHTRLSCATVAFNEPS